MVVLIALASCIWVPIGVCVGLRPRRRAIVQPVAQFLAAFPANLLFPVAVFGHRRAGKLNPDIWLSPLMILGTQWYILFNVIAGAAAIPARAARRGANLRVKRLAVVAEHRAAGVFPVLRHRRDHRLGRLVERGDRRRGRQLGRREARGRRASAPISPTRPTAGDFHRIVLGIAVMSLFVVADQPLFWRPLYCYAERKFRLRD